MATDVHSGDYMSVILKFLEGDSEEFEELGEPPLANRRDPLLDGDRIHLDRDENDEGVETGDE